MTQTVTVTNKSGPYGVKVFVKDRVIGPDKVSETIDLPNEGDARDVTIHSSRYLMVAEYVKTGIPPSPPPVPA